MFWHYGYTFKWIYCKRVHEGLFGPGKALSFSVSCCHLGWPLCKTCTNFKAYNAVSSPPFFASRLLASERHRSQGQSHERSPKDASTRLTWWATEGWAICCPRAAPLTSPRTQTSLDCPLTQWIASLMESNGV